MESLPPTPSVGRLSFSEVADQVVSQPGLFDFAGQPVEMDVVRAARRFPFTGTTVARDEKRAMAIAVMRMSGVSKRRIAKELACSPNTIDRVMEVLEVQGKIEAVKDRLPRLLAVTAEDAAEWARDLIAEGVVSTEVAATLKALGVLAGIGADKVAAFSQASGDVHLHQHVHLEGQDPMRAWLRERSRALSTDSEAADTNRNTLDVNVSEVAEPQAAAMAAAPAPPAAAEIHSPPTPTDLVTSSPADPAIADGGGGGVPPSADPHPT